MEKNNQPKEELNCSIYYRPFKKRIPVPAEFKAKWERYANSYRKKAQRNNRCCCPRKKWWWCDTDCDTCEFCISSENLSMDAEMKNSSGEATKLYDIFEAENAENRARSNDIWLFKMLIEELRKKDELSYDIIRLLCEGYSDRECAEKLNLTRYKYEKRREDLFDKIRKELS